MTQLPSHPATQLLSSLAILLLAAACGGSGASAPPAIVLAMPPDGGSAHVAVTGLSDSTRTALAAANLTSDQWASVFRVAVASDAPPMLGSYAVADGLVTFTPAFPFDAGRAYEVRFDLSRVPGADAGNSKPLVATVAPPASTATPSTVVTAVYPTGDVVPENLLRMYIEFSAPMGRPSGIEYLSLIDENGKDVPGAFLPLDYEFWSPDHRRFTVFFDPGRVKQGILPNQEMGRALRNGHRYTLVISREWQDAQGLPLKEPFRKALRAAPADTQPLDPARWKIDAPPAGGREPVTVTFPEPLDHGLLMRALGVRRDGMPVDGDTRVEATETRWTFTPRDTWRPGTYHLLALDVLEDVAGNQVGRAFEVDNFDTVDKDPNPQTITIPFRVAPVGTN